MTALLPAERAAELAAGPVTIDIDATDVEVYGSKKRGVAYNYQGQRAGRPHVASWAETEIPLAADLLSGDQDPRSHVVGLLSRALAALPQAVREGAAAAGRKIALRADAGYFAGDLARAAAAENMAFAIGAKRISSMWKALGPVPEDAWRDAIDMDNAQVAVSPYRPAGWPGDTVLLIRRVKLDPGQVSAAPRSRRRRTLHPDQRAMLFPELAAEPAIYAYSFICTNIDVSTPSKAAACEHWYRHRTSAENIFRDSKHGAALRHLPSGHEQVNTAWMWASLIAAAIAAWLHQLTGLIDGGELLEGHGTRGGKAMIATLRRVLIAVPARLVRHGGQLIRRPARACYPPSSPRSAPCRPPADGRPAPPCARIATTGTPSPQAMATRPRTRRNDRPRTRRINPGQCHAPQQPASPQDHLPGPGITTGALLVDSGQSACCRPAMSYCYRFDRVSPGAEMSDFRAQHTAELRYLFGTLTAEGYDDVDRQVSARMQAQWTAFARDGAPTEDGSWPRYGNAAAIAVIASALGQGRIGDDPIVCHVHARRAITR